MMLRLSMIVYYVVDVCCVLSIMKNGVVNVYISMRLIVNIWCWLMWLFRCLYSGIVMSDSVVLVVIVCSILVFGRCSCCVV